jgi:hypothetical protein
MLKLINPYRKLRLSSLTPKSRSSKCNAYQSARYNGDSNQNIFVGKLVKPLHVRSKQGKLV